MNPWRTAGSLPGFLLAAALVGCSPRAPTSIVLITIDTLRADRLSCYGYYLETSPEIDRFARDGILFENAFTHMANTLPAHVSLLTSTHPLRHGVRGNLSDHGVPFRSGEGLRSFPEMLARHGYRTAAIISAAPLRRLTGMSVGFETYEEPTAPDQKAAETTDRAIRWLRTRADAPFFLWVHYFDPHASYDPPEPFDTMFPTDDAQLRYLEENDFTYWDHPNVQRFNRLYDGEIRYTDAHVGRLLDHLREQGLYRDAAVIVTADHGEGLGQHDWMTHDRISGEMLHVPLVVKLPAARGVRPQRSERLTALVDVLPLLAEELDLPLDRTERAQFEGRNPLRAAERKFVFSERTLGRSEKVGPGEMFSVTSLAWKYFQGTKEPARLYDRREDPGETRNVLRENPDVVEALRSELLSWIARRASAESPGLPVELPEAYRDEMRALGYVD